MNKSRGNLSLSVSIWSFVRPLFLSLVSLESFTLRNFNGVLSESKEKVSWGSRKIKGCLKGVFSRFQRYLKEVQRELQERVVKGVSKKFKGCSKKDLKML